MVLIFWFIYLVFKLWCPIFHLLQSIGRNFHQIFCDLLGFHLQNFPSICIISLNFSLISYIEFVIYPDIYLYTF